MIYEFRFWKEWRDNLGRPWAEPYFFDTPTDARRAHTAALDWHWCTDHVSPSVSSLMSTAYDEDPVSGKKRQQNSTMIQPGAVRGFHEATLPRMREGDGGDSLPDALREPRAATSEGRFDPPF
jgi:hypothetical protein